MPYLQLNESKFPLFVGETHVGRGVGSDVPIPGTESEDTALVAVVTIGDDHVATIAGASQAHPIAVNGVSVGSEPSPLQHGDKIELEGVVMQFADEMQAMITAPHPSVQASVLPPRPQAPGAGGGPALTGGRLVSLIDGREYAVGKTAITIGRDAGCDVVVAVTEVSRRHARIEATAGGYALVDTSTNGVLLNGERIKGQSPLGRGDTIRVGPEEFRFHADTAAPPVVAAPRPPESPPAESVPPALPTTGRRPVLAAFEVLNEGVSKGTRYEITTPLSHVGRGPHNDIIVADDSVSDLHAKVQQRENGWFVVDMGSTNGTYVAGERVVGEARLVPNVDVRFGGMKFAFRDLGGGHDAAHGTRVIVGLKGPDAVRLSDQATKSAPPSGPERIGIPTPLLVALVALAVLIAFFILRGL